MKKIGCSQLSLLLTLTGTFFIISISELYSAEKIFGVVLFYVLLLIIGISIPQKVYQKNWKSISKTVSGIFLAVFILTGAFALLRVLRITDKVYFPVGSKWIIWVLIALVCLYGSVEGIKAVSESSVFVFALLCLSLLIMVFSSRENIKLGNISFSYNWSQTFLSLLSHILICGEIVALVYMLRFSEGNRKKGVCFYVLVKGIITVLVLVIGTATVGNLGSFSEYPFFSAVSLSKPFGIQRMDGLYIVLFTVLAVVATTFYVILSADALKNILPKLKYNEFAVTAVIVAVAFFMKGLVRI